ncbi:AAA family ATPase [Micromonospora chalcea]
MNPFTPGTEEHEAWERHTQRDTAVRDSVPNGTPAEQGKGHRDTRDTDGPESQESRTERLLDAIRDGAWLDAQEFPPLRYAVDGLVPEGFTVLVGPPKVGKSWLIGGMLLAIAGGGAALGRIRLSSKRRVLYLALEDGDRRMQSRCRKLLGDGEPLPALFHYVTRVSPNEVLATIDAFLARYPDTAMVVIDTLGKVMPPAGPNETTYQRDYRVGGRIKDIADKRPGLAVVAIHHDRKASADDFVERVSGTNGLAGSADTIVVLARKRQSTEGLLMVTGRDVPEAEYALEMTDGVNWTLDGHDLAAAAANARKREETSAGQVSDTSAQIIDFVRQHEGGVSRAQVVERFGDNAGRYLARHTDAGRLVRVGRGLYAVPSPVPSVPVSFSQVSDGTASDNGTRCPECSDDYDSLTHQINCEGLDG